MARKRSNNNHRVAGFEPIANPEYAKAMQELRHSSAASRHVLKARKGTRSAHKRAAISSYAA